MGCKLKILEFFNLKNSKNKTLFASVRLILNGTVLFWHVESSNHVIFVKQSLQLR